MGAIARAVEAMDLVRLEDLAAGVSREVDAKTQRDEKFINIFVKALQSRRQVSRRSVNKLDSLAKSVQSPTDATDATFQHKPIIRHERCRKNRVPCILISPIRLC